MAAVIDKGFLYIAQPPLFKVAEGKKETYLKDEKEMSRFLLARIGDDRSLTSEMSGASAAGAKLVALLEKMEEYRAATSRSSRRAGFRKGSCGRCSTAGCCRRAISPTRRKSRTSPGRRAPSTRSPSRSWPTRSIPGGRLIVRRVNGVARTVSIDAEFVGSYEMKRVREAARLIGAFLDGPYVVKRNGETERHQTLPAVVDAIYESAKKGLAINRYKGLGEMNPEQLWQTTMNPDTRRLLQVAIEDAVEANEVFSILMGDAVEPRREFIEKNALNVRNLDILAVAAVSRQPSS